MCCVPRYTFSNKCTINIVYDTLKKQSSLGAHKCPDGKCEDYDQKGLYPLYPLVKKEDLPKIGSCSPPPASLTTTMVSADMWKGGQGGGDGDVGVGGDGVGSECKM